MPAPARTHPIVAVATAPGTAGIGIVRLSGPGSIEIGRRIFDSNPQLGERNRHVEFGRILDCSAHPIDSGLAWVMKAPHSYTGEDTVEVSAHGSDAILEAIVQATIAHGATLAEPGEFTRRAFLNGKLDLIQAESVVELVQSQWHPAIEDAYAQASGRLSALIQRLKERLIAALALVEAGLDFSEDVDDISQRRILGEVNSAAELAGRLTETFQGARRRRDGLTVTLIGRPNVGKSTLMNALLGEERAIVTASAGTTRDLVEGQTLWQGQPVKIVDTAGLRQATELVEKEGVSRARAAAEAADFVIAVLDGSMPFDENDAIALELAGTTPGLAVANKCDLPTQLQMPAGKPQPLRISATEERGLETLIEAVICQLPERREIEGVALTKQRHRDLLAQASSSMETARLLIDNGPMSMDECVAAELQQALRALGSLLGEDIDEAILDKIFSEFCIGK